MAALRDEAVCIRHWDFSETSQTVSLFTRSHGLLRGLAKGAKRPGGRFSGGIDLLTRGEVVAITKAGRELATLTDWTLLRSWRAVREELAANQAAYYAIDLVQRLVEMGDPHPDLYDAITGCLELLERPGAAPAATLAFQLAILAEVGLQPRIELAAGGPATVHFSPAEGGTCAATVPGAWKVRRPTLELLVSMAERAFDDAAATAAGAPAETVQRANRLLAAFLRHHLGAEPATMSLLFPGL